jgi:hypothetical protein
MCRAAATLLTIPKAVPRSNRGRLPFPGRAWTCSRISASASVWRRRTAATPTGQTRLRSLQLQRCSSNSGMSLSDQFAAAVRVDIERGDDAALAGVYAD